MLNMMSNPINDSNVAEYLVLLLSKVIGAAPLRRFWKRSGSVVFVNSKLCLKCTSFTTLAEANAMAFVREYTSIPVPKVYHAFEHKGLVYILMERISGVSVSREWTQRPEKSKQKILAQLTAMVDELRNLKPRDEFGAANVDGGPIYDPRLPSKSSWGPFRTIDDFHRELRNGIEANMVDDDTLPGLLDLISFHDQSWPDSVFTHGDLSSLNILARGDKVVGLIDWETAGWMPPYLEYTTAWNVNPQNTFWQDEVDKFVKPLPYALQMETIRRRYFGYF